ncbi:MAG: hypothetical protein QOE29_203 [Gaiellaceae bacterium]|nr:hypothetical protein [Gaiellaceae bacterium]
MRRGPATVLALKRLLASRAAPTNGHARPEAPARVLLADPDPLTRARLRAALASCGFVVCAEATTGGSALRAAVLERPDLCLLDVGARGEGILAAQAITRRLPDVAVVMLAVSDDMDQLFEALRAGVYGYLRKDVDPKSLAAALRGVLAGEAALTRVLMARVLDEFRGRSRRQRLRVLGSARPAELTVREWDVLELMRTGLSNAEIAERLFIAPVTVRTHRRSILAKLAVSDRSGALEQVASD